MPGLIYGISSSGEIVTTDAATGQELNRTTTSPGVADASGLAYDSNSDTLYAIANPRGGSGLYTVGPQPAETARISGPRSIMQFGDWLMTPTRTFFMRWEDRGVQLSRSMRSTIRIQFSEQFELGLNVTPSSGLTYDAPSGQLLLVTRSTRGPTFPN